MTTFRSGVIGVKEADTISEDISDAPQKNSTSAMEGAECLTTWSSDLSRKPRVGVLILSAAWDTPPGGYPALPCNHLSQVSTYNEASSSDVQIS